MGPLFRMQVYSHFFKITAINPRVNPVLLKFCSKYAVYTMGKSKRDKPEYKVFGTRTLDGSEYRFHIGQYEEFIKDITGAYITRDMYLVETMSLYTPCPIETFLKPSWELRDYQLEVVDFITSNELSDLNSRMVALPTGKGKTVCALAAIGKIKTRTLLFILPTYIERWVTDMPNILELTPKDIVTIQGSGQLRSIILSGLDDAITAKFIVLSITTLKNYIKEYERNPRTFIDDEGYGCVPDDLCRVLGAGSVIIDETHQHLHGVYKILAYTHIPKVIALSATLISQDPVIGRVQHVMFPKELRFDSVSIEQYIKVYAIYYQFTDFPGARIRVTEHGSNNYSHHAYEKSILKNKKSTQSYLELITYIVQHGFVVNHMEGDKIAIYASSLDMCGIIVEHLKAVYPKYDIRRYAEKDPYENLIDPDIRVTTLGSAGTAHDIAGLRSVLLTTSIKSPESNIQVLGRLRKLKDRDVKFYYIYCEQIPKQVNYHKEKIVLYRDKTASIKELKYPKGL